MSDPTSPPQDETTPLRCCARSDVHGRCVLAVDHPPRHQNACGEEFGIIVPAETSQGDLMEVICRARLFKKIGRAGCGIQMHQLMQVEIEFSLSNEQVMNELRLAWSQDAAAEIARLTKALAESEKVRKQRHEHFLIVAKYGIKQKARAEAPEAENAKLRAWVGMTQFSFCSACEMCWSGPYTDCPGCHAQAGMKGVSDLQQEILTLRAELEKAKREKEWAKLELAQAEKSEASLASYAEGARKIAKFAKHEITCDQDRICAHCGRYEENGAPDK